MTSIFAIAFETAAAAEGALAELMDHDSDDGVRIRDAAIVLRTGRGDIELQQTKQIAAGEGLAGGGTAGLIAGLLFGFPISAALVGLAAGGAFGLRDTGLPDDRMRKLGEELRPGQAVLCVLVDVDAVQRAREVLSGYGTVAEVELESGSDP